MNFVNFKESTLFLMYYFMFDFIMLPPDKFPVDVHTILIKIIIQYLCIIIVNL